MAHAKAGTMRVRPMTSADIRSCATLHAKSLPHGFFAHLGIRYLRTYYRSFLVSPCAVFLVAESDTGFAGCLVGTLDARAHYAWVVRHRGWRLGLAGGMALLARPRLALRFLRLRARRYVSGLRRHLQAARHLAQAGSDSLVAGSTADATPVAVLTHVCVNQESRGLGAGSMLVSSFVEAARAAGAGTAKLVTLVEGGAGDLYVRLGWRHVDDRVGADGWRISEFEFPLGRARQTTEDLALRVRAHGRASPRRL